MKFNENKYNFRIFFFITFIVSYTACLAQKRLGTRVDSLFTAYIDSGFAGSALVSEKNEITLQKGYGYANNEKKQPNTPPTLFNIASIGKQFTAYSVLLLEQQGKLSTNDLVSKYTGLFNDGRDGVTIHHLLIHSSGLFAENTILDYTAREKFIQSVKAGVMEALPGKLYRYSNAGYSMLAAIVEIISGQPFEKFINDHVFIPCGMKDTGYPWEERMNKTLFATGYDDNKQPVAPQPDIWAARGPGNLMTSTVDLYKWMTAIQDDQFMPAVMKKKIFYDYVPGKESYTWNKTTTSRKTRFYQKNGGRADFESQLMWYPDDEVIIIFFINNNYNVRRKLFAAIRSMMN